MPIRSFAAVAALGSVLALTGSPAATIANSVLPPAFRVGEDDRHITSIDEDGVALAAIKALNLENYRLRDENAAIRAHSALTDLRLAAVERLVLRLVRDSRPQTANKVR